MIIPTSLPWDAAPIWVKTKNLFLRRPNSELPEDLKLYTQLYQALKNDKGFWFDDSRVEGIDALRRTEKDWENFKVGEYIVSANGVDIGMAGLQVILDKNTQQLHLGSISAILPEYRRKGYGTEAQTAVLMVGKILGIQYLRRYVRLDNRTSLHISEKLGGITIEDSHNIGNIICFSVLTRRPDKLFKYAPPEASRPHSNVVEANESGFYRNLYL